MPATSRVAVLGSGMTREKVKALVLVEKSCMALRFAKALAPAASVYSTPDSSGSENSKGHGGVRDGLFEEENLDAVSTDGYWGFSTPGGVVFLGNLHGLKERQFGASDPSRDFRKIAAFEDRLRKPKPLL